MIYYSDFITSKRQEAQTWSPKQKIWSGHGSQDRKRKKIHLDNDKNINKSSLDN